MNDILTVSEHQNILVSSKRDISKNTISIEDKEVLFNVTYQDKKGNTRYIVSRSGNRGNEIKVNSIVGSVSLKTGLTLEILPKFAKDNLDKESIKKHRKMLLNILRVSNEKNFISSASQSSKLIADEMPLLHYVIELFSIELLHTLRSGSYATYIKKVENSSHIRGNILVSKTIQNNIIDKSKVYHSYQEHSSNNLLMQVFRSLSKLLLNDKNLSYKAKQTLHEVYLLLDEVDIIPLKKQDFKSITFNRLNDKFEILFTQAEFIFNQYMPFTSHINSTPFWAILFDMNYLFEKFCAYLLRRSDIEIQEQSIIQCFKNEDKFASAKPDFILSQENNIIVADAKWKLLSKNKSIYGLDAQNFWQLFSYMNLVSVKEQVYGYFIVPKNNNDCEDEIIFSPIKENNKSISILSIDFSLDFDELIERYQFEIVEGALKLKVKVVIEKKVEIIEKVEEFQFNLEDFINELEVLYHNKNIRKKLSPNRMNDKFKNLYYLKEKYKANSQAFKISVKENLNKTSWSFDGVGIKDIPDNIIKFKNLHQLSLMNNNISLLSKNIFNLSKLILLDISNNHNLILPRNILDLKSLKVLLIDKEIIKTNIFILEQLEKNGVILKDENNQNIVIKDKHQEVVSSDIENKSNKINNDESSINTTKTIDSVIFTENMKSKLSVFEKVSYVDEMFKSGNYDSQKDLANAISKSYTFVSKCIKIMTLNPAILEDLKDGRNKIGMDNLFELTNIKDHIEQLELFKKNLTVKELRSFAKEKTLKEMKHPYSQGNNYYNQDYKSMNKDEKITFLRECNFRLINKDIIETIVDENDIDILEDFTYNKTLPLKYLLLTYNINFDRDKSEVLRLKENLKKKNHSILNDLIRYEIYELGKYIEDNFRKIDKELLLGYVMTPLANFSTIKEKIVRLTNDLDILDELSKHRDNSYLLQCIIFKTKNNPIFTSKINGRDTIYSTKTLARIATYTEYPELLKLLSTNYNITYETEEKLSKIFQKDTIVEDKYSSSKPFNTINFDER